MNTTAELKDTYNQLEIEISNTKDMIIKAKLLKLKLKTLIAIIKNK